MEKYFVLYFGGIGYNLFNEVELDDIDMNDATIEYSGSYEECIDYLNKEML